MLIEKNAKRQIIIASMLVTVISIILGVTSYVWWQNAAKAQIEEAKRILDSSAELHKSSVVKQLEGDLQTLSTLSAYLEKADAFNDNALLSCIQAANAKNDFIRMGIIDTDMNGNFVILDGRVYRNENVAGNEAIIRALNGESVVSGVIEDAMLEQRVIQYAVPVYRNDVVIGALTATNDVEVLESLISDAVFAGQGRIHLIESDGDFVIRTQNAVIEQDIHNVFEGNVIDADEIARVTKELNQGKDTNTWAAYKEIEYELEFKNIGINNWYVFCVAPRTALLGSFKSVMNLLQRSFILILIMIVCLVIFIFRVIWNNNSVIMRMAYYDSLTGAYNRNYFSYLEKELFASKHEFVLAMINIEKFQVINELFGAQKGDELLCYIKRMCDEIVMGHEIYCRTGGDRFALLLLKDEEGVLRNRLNSLMESISRFSLSDNQNYKIICSCGVKYISEEERNININLQMNWVELALKEAQGFHENMIVFYDERMHKKLHMRSEIESQMDEALQEHHFIMKLQPKVDLKTGKLHSAEALVRWERKDGAVFYPDQFIYIFEQNGFCVKLDMYMLEEACRKLREWMDKGYPVVPISVNQSRLVFYKGTYLDQIKEIIAKYKIPASMIMLEVTEGLAMSNEEEMKKMIAQMHEIGFGVSMDDFGSGYSSLNTLKDFQIDELKLDKKMLEEGIDLERRDLIMKNIVNLAHDLHILTVAEGIETKEQKELVESIGCDIGQGYYYAKPIGADEFETSYFSGKSNAEK
ncbi:EAL domain-containing protein [Clostridium sp. AM58-1XD]|uniref:bifunctional diguanylate cyclase/phosphodiesterase n=1 Tax=Clostridium sp. AM58-1XD TaxID=2292307 RepID=UPI000E4BAFBD|nr:EAL domain-containing protein [Clostridium sp. AM58-1XD]RGY97640.1 EAL domain-containing protein [Clostridium sp. AM58-1XD]